MTGYRTAAAVVVALTVLASLSATNSQASRRAPGPQRATDAIEEVWAREDAYWRYVAAGDVEQYLTLWNRDFRGWPCATEHPATKATISDWVREIRDRKIRFSYDLKREGAASVGGVVVVYYRTPMIYRYADGKVEGRGKTRKFTHTWLNVNGTWQIIGGMCGADAPRA
jgi:hypothetical protein